MSNERRTRRLCLIALAVLLPFALWTAAREDVTRAWQAHAIEAIDADPTQATSFAGLSWRFLGWDATEDLKRPATTEINVRVQLDDVSQQAIKSLGNCWPYLEDSSGQRWSRVPPKRNEISCSRLAVRAEAGGNQIVLTERFLIPTARASEVSLVFVIPKQRPRYLRFQRSAQ